MSVVPSQRYITWHISLSLKSQQGVRRPSSFTWERNSKPRLFCRKYGYDYQTTLYFPCTDVDHFSILFRLAKCCDRNDDIFCVVWFCVRRSSGVRCVHDTSTQENLLFPFCWRNFLCMRWVLWLNVFIFSCKWI